MVVVDPTLKHERALHRDGVTYVIGCDEVGRGAIAGPVAVGLCVVAGRIRSFPKGLRDSKMLSEKHRELLAPQSRKWALHSAVGLATPREIDRLGLSIALGLAGKRALAALVGAGVVLEESVVLLDGSYDYLNPVLATRVRLETRVKADQECASVAAASVIAKVHRDHLMIDADAMTPGYLWSENKGYGSAAHFAAIEQLGATDFHRRSWLRQPELLQAALL
ncbi:ribonuclease HII [Parafrigoribacterium mesophilum]|uniref:ribonuclease HII n=1 Tax=Parafrigoribacterium mesophilum TaxID=433646 RepID=UPI0031FD6D17